MKFAVTAKLVLWLFCSTRVTFYAHAENQTMDGSGRVSFSQTLSCKTLLATENLPLKTRLNSFPYKITRPSIDSWSIVKWPRYLWVTGWKHNSPPTSSLMSHLQTNGRRSWDQRTWAGNCKHTQLCDKGSERSVCFVYQIKPCKWNFIGGTTQDVLHRVWSHQERWLARPMCGGGDTEVYGGVYGQILNCELRKISPNHHPSTTVLCTWQ